MRLKPADTSLNAARPRQGLSTESPVSGHNRVKVRVGYNPLVRKPAMSRHRIGVTVDTLGELYEADIK